MDPNLARSIRKQIRTNDGREDISFRKHFKGKGNDLGEEALKEENLKKQVDYFGYVIEPFNMKNEREIGEITEDGYFAVNLKRERATRDAWLDSLEEDPFNGGIQKVGEPYSKEDEEEEDEEDSDEEGFKKPKKKVAKPVKSTEESKIDDDPKLLPQKIIGLKMELVEYLQKGENPSMAMIRFKEQLPKKLIPKKKNVRKKVKGEEGSKGEEVKMTEESTGELGKKLDRLIEITATLFESGVLNIYTLKQEDLISELLALQKSLEVLDNPQADIDCLYNDEDDEAGKKGEDVKPSAASPKKVQKENEGQHPQD